MAKILVFGDSITYGKWDRLGGWVQRLRAFLDKKFNLKDSKNIQVYNLGIPGEVTGRLTKRIANELVDRVKLADTKKNNIVVIFVGLNDVNKNNWMIGRRTDKSDFTDNLKKIVSIVRKFECLPVIIGMTPVNEKIYIKHYINGLENKDIEQYDELLKNTALSLEADYVNLWSLLNTNEYKSNLVDGIHPDEKGHEKIFRIVKDYLIRKKLIEYLLED